MDIEKKLKKLDVVMVSHIFVTGAFLDLEKYLKTKVNSLLFIGHPFSFRKEINSFYRYYTKGKLRKEHKAFGFKLSEILLYCKDAFYTFWWVFTQKTKFDLYIAADNFDAYLGLWLKKLNKVSNVVFYTIDYIPQRFKNPFLNFLYHYFDRQCLKNSKIVWNISPNMAKAREQFVGLRLRDCVPQIVVPQGIWHNRIPKIPLRKKSKQRIIFLGHLVERQGLDLVIQAMKEVVKKIPKVELIVIGTGSYEGSLKALVKKEKLEKTVTFTGYMENDKDIEMELAKSTIAVAMYKPSKDSLTYFADPGKIKNYLSAGLPIILTNVPPVAADLEKKRCAIISDYNKSELSKHITDLLLNTHILKKYSKNAIDYASNFDYNKIYNRAFSYTLN